MSRWSPGRSTKGVHSGTPAAYFHTGTGGLGRTLLRKHATNASACVLQNNQGPGQVYEEEMGKMR